MMRQLLPTLFCLLAFSVFGQEVKINNSLEGYWTGAFIRNGNSIQSLTVDFYIEDDTLQAALPITSDLLSIPGKASPRSLTTHCSN